MKLVQQAPPAYQELCPWSLRTQGCLGSAGPKERRAIRARLGTRDHRVILERWGLRDPLDHRVPRDRKAHRGRPEQLGLPVLLAPSAPPAPVAPQAVRAPQAPEAPLGKTGNVGRREQWEKMGFQGRLAPGVILVLLGSRAPPEKGRTESRDFGDHQDYLDLWEPRGTAAHLGPLALLATAETRALGSPALLAPPDPQEKKGPRDLEAHLECPAPRDQLARMVYQDTPAREGLPESQAPLHCCLPGT